MAHVSYTDPVEHLTGRKNSKSETYYCVRLGKKIISHYPLHKDPKTISTRQRDVIASFSQAVRQAQRELADPERKAYWQQLFDEQKRTATKPYLILRNFVIASLSKK